MKEFKKKEIIETYYLSNGVSDCKNLGEMRKLIDSLIKKYGENAHIHFDSGYNSISEEIKVSRLESEEEFEKKKKQRDF